MASTSNDNIFTVLSISGGNDGLNTIIPYTDGLYRQYRPTLGIPADKVLPINDQLAFHPAMAPLKTFWDEGKLAIFLGIGYPHPSYSHFRSMDIWHTCEPDQVGVDGWLGRAIQEIDPKADNVLTGVNFGRGLPRALAKAGVPVASVGDLETYGLLTDIEGQDQRAQALDVFAQMYGRTVGTGYAMNYILRTGLDALKGADILATAPGKYTSTVTYPKSTVGGYMRNIVQTHLADFGTRILYTTSPYNSFDTHANQAPAHEKLWTDVSTSVKAYFDDLREHQASDNVLLFMFSEFGRRIADNGSGTDHGAAGVAFAVGEKVKGGIYGTYPSLKPSDQEEGGNLKHNLDFRSVYAGILEDWLGMNPTPIIGGQFDPVRFLN
jgi:uncharacterized protein (DUF1501 family)